MLFREYGSKMLGFTKEMKCNHCNGESPQQVRQDYVKQTVFLIPIPSHDNRIFLFCPICENKENLSALKPMFSSQQKMNYILELLDSGKEYTKYWLEKLDFKEKEEVLKSLNKINAHSVVRFVSGVK